MLRKSSFAAVTLVAVTGLLMGGKPSFAAEQLSLSTGESELVTLSVSELETYATTGQPSQDLDALLGLIPEEVHPTIKGALSYRVIVEPQPFQQFLSSNLGQNFLTQISDIFQPGEASTSSVEALQTAINEAAAPGTGFSMVDVMKAYPTAKILLSQEAINEKAKGMGTFGSDLQLLLASFGVDVDVSQAKLDIPAIATLVKNGISVGQEVNTFAQTSGLTELELDSPEPPTGTVTLQKADLHRLYKRFSALQTQSEQLYQDSGITIEVAEPQ